MRKIILIAMVLVLFSCLVSGEKVSDPSEEKFGGTSLGDRLEIGETIKLVQGNDDTYLSEIIDAEKVVDWGEIKLRLFEEESDASSHIVVVESDETIDNYVLNVQIENFTFTGKLRIEDGDDLLPYWIDESKDVGVYIKLNITEGEKKILYIYYGDDSIGYDADCEDVFVICDTSIYNKKFYGDASSIKEFSDLGVWETYTDPSSGLEITDKRYVNIQYKYTLDVDKSCGGKYSACKENATVYTKTTSDFGDGETIDGFEFNDVNLYPFNQEGGDYWKNKTAFGVRGMKTNHLDSVLDFSFNGNYDSDEEVFSFLLTDILVGYSGLTEPTYSLGNQELGISILVRACDDAECQGDKFVATNETLPDLDHTRYFQYKLEFKKNDFLPEVYGVSLYFDESNVPAYTDSLIYEAEVKINDLEELDIDASSAQELLDRALEKFDEENYSDAIKLAKQAKEDAELLYENYLANEGIRRDQEGKKDEYESEQNKIRAEELLDLAEIALGTADHTNVDTQRAEIMLTQAQIAYDSKNYALAIERSNDALEILGAKVPEPDTPPNIVGIVVLVVGVIILGAVIYAFLRAQLNKREEEGEE